MIYNGTGTTTIPASIEGFTIWWQSLLDHWILALHIPDGFLHAPVALLWRVPTVIMIGLALRAVQRSAAERTVPLMSVLAVAIFAAQMLNFPIVGGTSGHLLDGMLAAIVLGPWAGMVVMTCVIALQAIVFQDGGIVAVGANIFNMRIATAAIGGWIARPLLVQDHAFTTNRLRIALVATATGWSSVMVAAILTSAQLVLSDLPAGIVFPAMIGVHALIGIGEGVLTATALLVLVTARPDILQPGDTPTPMRTRLLTAGVFIAALLAALAPLASPDPDGLERVAEEVGFLDRALDAPYRILPDYTVPLLGETPLSTIVSGLIGVIITVGIVWGIAVMLRARTTSRS
ncbi:energy-coupling factor ABC transporter permease [Chloroflexus sp.]|uniref:energy-coupling factor ABC transporter permease n=1 Tax=Chloroflexus sp. TaxID=1904827 RepID=UPI00404AE29A